MQIEYDLTVDDLQEFNEFFAAQSPTIRRIKRLNMVLGPVTFLCVGAALSLSKGDYSGIVIFGVLALGWLFWFHRYWQWSFRRRLRKLLREGPHSGMPEHIVLRLEEDGIHQATTKGTSHFRWAAIELVASSEHAVYLYTGPANALIVPRRAIGDVAACERFTGEVRRFREQAAGLHAIE